MRILITGCAGFIGSHLSDYCLANDHQVIGVDNFSTGFRQHLEKPLLNPNFTLAEFSLLETNLLNDALKGVDMVFHLAANADVRFGLNHPQRDLEQNTIATFNVLEGMRKNGVKRLVFTSTGAIYGNAKVIPTPEDAPFPIQTSLYGASKLACEGMMQAYHEGYGFDVSIFRLVSLMGERYSHGHVYDFCKKLLANPDSIDVLGDGLQKKSYLYVKDAINALVLPLEQSLSGLHTFNLGRDDCLTVKDSLAFICECLGVKPTCHFQDKKAGWIGDSPHILLSCEKLKALGWQANLSYPEMISRTLKFMLDNPWFLK